MGLVQQERFNEIAQWLEAAGKVQLYRSSTKFTGEGSSAGEKAPWLAGWKKAFEGTGIDYSRWLSEDRGASVAQDLYGLKLLMRSGKITVDEVRGFLNRRYDGAVDWTGEAFASTTKSAATESLNEALALPSEDPGKKQEEQRALLAQQVAGPGGKLDQQFGDVAIHAPEIDDGPVQGRDLRRVVDDIIDQVSLRMSSIAQGQINFRANSIDARALKPGTLSYDKIEPVGFHRAMNTWPGPDQAIRLSVARDPSVDRWHEATPTAFTSDAAAATQRIFGPGRVWRVQSYAFPDKTYRPSPGPVRYRVVLPNLEFGLMSMLKANDGLGWSDANGTWELVWGVVIRGIPNFYDRAPDNIFWMGWDGDVPTSLEGDVVNTGGVGPTSNLYEDRAIAEFTSVNRAALAAYNKITAGNYRPTATIIEGWKGISAMLVTGRTDTEVFEQLNGRECQLGMLRGNPHGPMSSAPSGLRHKSPAVPSIVVSTNGTLSNIDPKVKSSDPLPQASANARRVVQGVPFLYEDCARLRPTTGADGSFAIALELVLDYTVLKAQIVTWQGSTEVGMEPGAWWTQGLRVVEQNNREIAVDIIVG